MFSVVNILSRLENKDEAIQKIKDHCGCRICPITTTLQDDEINWNFDIVPEVKVKKTKKVS